MTRGIQRRDFQGEYRDEYEFRLGDEDTGFILRGDEFYRRRIVGAQSFSSTSLESYNRDRRYNAQNSSQWRSDEETQREALDFFSIPNAETVARLAV